MKTPREILLARHRAAEPRLDALRQTMIKTLPHQDPGTPRATPSLAYRCLHWLTAPWRELILPTRRIWTGLAAVWTLLFLINASQRDPVSSTTGQPVHSPGVTMSWQTQQRWINELLADRPNSSPEADRPRNPAVKPQTENCGIAAA